MNDNNPHDCAGLPTRAQLRDQLTNAENQFMTAHYIDNFARREKEQAYWAPIITDLKGKLARLEYRDAAGEEAA